ncbi:ATP-dependent helicase [Candidatus Saccharibacteria bacterium]|nr:ATP-dependent helicase [Candidatus Saccharibacteria bacterium]
MENFKKTYQKLNPEQKAAVDYIDGPLLVIAGPGTGKTQLLSVRVANILKNTDINPENILCLTFTETGAENMRNRLYSFIGQAAYKIPVYTYHSLGSAILQDFHPELNKAADELTQNIIIRDIQKKLHSDNILRHEYQIPDIISTISDIKSANLEPNELKTIAKRNETDIAEINSALENTLNSIPKGARFNVAIPFYQEIATGLSTFTSQEPILKNVEPIANEMLRQLERIIEEESSKEKPSASPLSKWREKYCRKDKNNVWHFDNLVANLKLQSIAEIMEQYQIELNKQNSFDFDDMIIQAIKSLEKDRELRLNLQERFQYILLDEFQDTNDAQAKLVELLAINPINDNSPNIMAVGDDDQAIYGFQGASKSNFYDFDQLYHPKHIFLNKNYRSSKAILDFAHNIIEQGTDRFSQSPNVNIDKIISAENPPDQTKIEHQEYKTTTAEYSNISVQIKNLVEQGINPSNIAVIAPKHQSLKNLVPFLKYHNLDISYRLRENILEEPVISQTVTTLEFIITIHDALSKQKLNRVDYLVPYILNFKCWNFTPIEIISILDQVKRSGKPFMEYVSTEEEAPCSERLKEFTNFYSNLALKIDNFSAEYIINEIIKKQFSNEDNYILFTDLLILRDLAKSSQDEQKLLTKDFLEMLQNYQQFSLTILNKSPYCENPNAIQLLTVHSAKGLEFDYVFLLDSDDKNWSNAKGNTNKLTLPHNLEFVRHTGDSADEKLRVLFVAITRAKKTLIMASSSSSLSGKDNPRLRFLEEIEIKDDTGSVTIHANTIPEPFNKLLQLSNEEITINDLQNTWFSPYLPQEINDPNILKEKVRYFKLTASKAKAFIDLEYSNMSDFIKTYIYGWPSSAPSSQIAYGNAIHYCMDHLVKDQLSDEQTLQLFETEIEKADLDLEERKELLNTRKSEFKKYLSNRGKILREQTYEIMTEKSLNGNIVMGDVEMTGKLDRIEIDHINKTITVVDFKTGRTKEKWNDSDSSSFGYKLQLYFYKFLIEQSQEFKNYKVNTGRIEFIPTNERGDNVALTLEFNDKDNQKFKKLFTSIFHHVKELNLPDTSKFNSTKAFVDFLISE